MWEYKILGPYSVSVENLNDLGTNGWELVTSYVTSEAEVLILKRKIIWDVRDNKYVWVGRVSETP